MLKRFQTTLCASAIALGLVLVSTAPANAHTQSEAIANGCGSGFAAASDGTRAVTTGSSTWGYVHLAYNNSTGVNCVVTRKTSYHGTASRVSVELIVQNTGTYYKSDPDAGHWESVSHAAAGRCVQYYGWVWNPAGTVVSGGGRQTWGNCG
ncbi:hypothetical protein ACSHWB_40170 [Lentzea sp. HUAS TT2]|uniref:hypothetical protein n=1 Tax=Lentzea sp. HUAS TT2 TaxID=3447454 RepID=UPI003F70B609